MNIVLDETVDDGSPDKNDISLPPSIPLSLPLSLPQVTGVLRGFDQFMNIVLDETVDDGSPDKNDIGLVVIRGNSVVQFECLEKL